ncbi:MAG: GHKL domain-containing protein [Ruminococcus flavefaciens]|nr:GHKL domain-containing protein [Ruminococcus flavefaciens]
MTFLHITILLFDAIHILILMRFCRNCIGVYRVNRKISGIAVAVYWVLSSYMRFLPFSQKFSAANSLLIMAEFIFLFIISFFYQGKLIRRFIITFTLPILYWGGNCIITLTLFHTTRVEDKQYLISAIISTILFLALEFILEKLKISKHEQERELLKQEIRIYENQFEIIHQSQKNIRSLKHDLKHHIKMLADLISNGQEEAALEYLYEMGAFMENSEEYICSGNEKIDSILNYMIAKSKAEKIDTDWKILIPEYLDISTFDINVILSNLFDNALNALSKVKEPRLYILMKYDRGVLCISVQNNCADFQLVDKKSYLTVDINNGHGYGLKNIQRIVDKYNGNLSTEYKDGIFTSSVLLFITDSLPN